MMEALAEVLDVGKRALRVRIRDHGGGCGRCDEPGGCRAVQISHAFGRPRSEFKLARPTALELRRGDLLQISIAEGAALKAALAAYGLGALLMVVGAALAAWLLPAGGDAVMLLGAAAGLLLTWGCNRVLLRSWRWRGQFRLQLLAPAVAAAKAAASCHFADLAGGAQAPEPGHPVGTDADRHRQRLQRSALSESPKKQDGERRKSYE